MKIIDLKPEFNLREKYSKINSLLDTGIKIKIIEVGETDMNFDISNLLNGIQGEFIKDDMYPYIFKTDKPVEIDVMGSIKSETKFMFSHIQFEIIN